MPGKAALDAAQAAAATQPDLEMLLWRVPAAVLLGFVTAGVYHAAHGRQGTNALRTTLVLLCLLVAIVTIVIGDNLARAFGLVGALSIVRFRTVVSDTRDTAFVIFAVVVGEVCGAASAKQGAVVELKYRVRLPSAAVIAALVAELNRTDGVQGVELKANGDE